MCVSVKNYLEDCLLGLCTIISFHELEEQTKRSTPALRTFAGGNRIICAEGSQK